MLRLKSYLVFCILAANLTSVVWTKSVEVPSRPDLDTDDYYDSYYYDCCDKKPPKGPHVPPTPPPSTGTPCQQTSKPCDGQQGSSCDAGCKGTEDENEYGNYDGEFDHIYHDEDYKAFKESAQDSNAQTDVMTPLLIVIFLACVLIPVAVFLFMRYKPQSGTPVQPTAGLNPAPTNVEEPQAPYSNFDNPTGEKDEI